MESSFVRARVMRASRTVGLAAAGSLVALQVTAAVSPTFANVANSIAGVRLFVSPDSPAKRQADAWRKSRPSDAALMQRIAEQPVARWMGNWNRNVRGDVAAVMSDASRQGATPVLVAYNIPSRDCGSYSAGGSSGAGAYRKWIRDFAAGLGGRRAIVVLEPDALGGADCLSADKRDERFSLLRDAVEVLKGANAIVYIDAGNAKWHTASAIAQRLSQAGISAADGFALNVSNYQTTQANVAYGASVSKLVGGKHYVIDTSRNGIGVSNGKWCNVPGAALGAFPTTKTGHALVDAYLWIKQPGESDGSCNGGPGAGQWWADYALNLARTGAQVASR
jgi:endoglucanase